jgi:hypothetical protein
MTLGKLGAPILSVSRWPELGLGYGSRLFVAFHKFAEESEVGRAIAVRLDNDPRFKAIDGQMLNKGSGASRLQRSDLQAWFLWRANEIGLEQADRDLENFLSSEQIDAIAALWVYGVETSSKSFLGA